MGAGEFGNYNLHTLEEVLVDLLSVVLWHQHIGVEYLKVVEVGIQIFLFFFQFSYTRVSRTGGRTVSGLDAGPHTIFSQPTL